MTFRRIALLAATLAAAGLAQRVAAQPAAVPPALGQHVAAYSAAWGSRDPARIPALHTADTVFDLRVDGETPAVGRQAAQAQFARILRDNPGYASTVGKVGFGPDFVVIEYTIAMDPAVPFALGRFCYQPTGVAYTVPAIDVIRFREGLVSEKVTFLDTEVIRANSRDTVALKAGR